MALITILTPEQLAEREQKPKGRGRSGRRRSPQRTAIIESYKKVLQEAQPGYGGDLLLTEDEEKRVMRQNLKAAAEELSLALDFRPIKDPTRIHFRVITLEQRAAKPKRGGRPRKNSQVQDVQVESEPEQSTEMPDKRTRRASRKRAQ